MNAPKKIAYLPFPKTFRFRNFATVFSFLAFGLSSTVSAYTSSEIVQYNPTLSEILESGDSASANIPFLPKGYSEDGDESDGTDFEPSEEIAEGDSVIIDMTKAYFPLESARITSPFGFRGYRIHKGIDVGLTKGDTIRAAFPGKVTRVRYERRGYGNYIMISHIDCGVTKTIYAHLSKTLVKVGDEVQAGDVIGRGGSTGRSTGPHLHFEMRLGDMPLDPNEYFDFAAHTFKNEPLHLSVANLKSSYAEIEKEASKHRFYKVRPGDTLGKIAHKYGISINRLCQLNGIKRTTKLRIGRMIRCS